MPSILFVCLGNICRSPAAEGMLRKKVDENGTLKNITIDSCGLGDWHEGQLPDERMRAAAKSRGLALTMRARSIRPKDMEEFDYILAASRTVINDLYHYATNPQEKGKIQLITAYSKTYHNQDIPDPYHKDAVDFDLVLDILEDCCDGLLNHLTSRYSST